MSPVGAGLERMEVEVRHPYHEALELLGREEREGGAVTEEEEALLEGGELGCDRRVEHPLGVAACVLGAVGVGDGRVGAIWHELRDVHRAKGLRGHLRRREKA